VAQLESEKVPAAQKYSAQNLEKSLKKKQKNLSKAKRDEEREMWEARKSKEDYERKIKE
jgi:hypothetical protein